MSKLYMSKIYSYAYAGTNISSDGIGFYTSYTSLSTHRLSADLVGDAFGEEGGEENRWDILFAL